VMTLQRVQQAAEETGEPPNAANAA
jgi:hypothetical protein